jgi:GrpB-like predicted nucleotidyltransferase (UPF0157 family)/protein-S-isoprenylcysteine O-methyltransferase Ste14
VPSRLSVIGLRDGVVELRTYTPEWKTPFEEEKVLLEAAVGEYVLDIQHVGSTAIPGVIAKPIIDIAIAVADFDDARACVPPIERLGYCYRGEYGIPRRHYFEKGSPRTHHIHAFEIESDRWRDHLLFRDYLIRRPAMADEYAAPKQQLAQRYPRDRDAYVEGKAPFIQRALEMARAANPPALLFISAGTLQWPMAWVYTGLFLVSAIGSRLVVLKKSPDTLRERARFATAEGRKGWDRVLGPVVGFYGPMAMMIVAGLDERFGWSAVLPPIGHYAAALVTAGAYGLAAWAMVVNAYFSAVARVQHDRQQGVVTAGPYRVVRHPSYSGAFLGCLSVPLMLDALWALLPAAIEMAALALRAGLEDRMLREGLDGYKEYGRATPYRLIPGIW